MPISMYRGKEQLVIGTDVGTARSTVLCSYLRDGEEPRVWLIMKWPLLASSSGDCTIPTLVRYDANNKALAFGRSARLNEDDQVNAHLAERFDLWLHP